MSSVTLQIKRLHPDVDLPAYQSELAAGLDLHAAIDAAVTIPQGHIAVISVGFAMSIPPGYEAQVRPRSGLAVKHGISIPNAPGTIDADYRGEVKVPLINLGLHPFIVTPNMRIAQMVIAAVAHATIRLTDDLDPTARGTGGFGSTGH
ncbi:MAG: dUTP diphosphatase [Phycisphaerales bacterium]|nr:dUTP diphosphatase [Phycisphaerales bacterium]